MVHWLLWAVTPRTCGVVGSQGDVVLASSRVVGITGDGWYSLVEWKALWLKRPVEWLVLLVMGCSS